MKNSIYETNYNKLLKILGNLDLNFEALKLKSGGFMDLGVDKLGEDKIALSHYYKQNGDMVADPDMIIKIHKDLKMVEAVTYQDSFGFRAVYPEEGKVDLRAKKDLNSFLGTWLRNLINQGFKAGVTNEI